MATETWGMSKQQKKLLDIFDNLYYSNNNFNYSVEHEWMLGSIYLILLMFTVVASHNKDVSKDVRGNQTEFPDQSSHCYVESVNGFLIN